MSAARETKQNSKLCQTIKVTLILDSFCCDENVKAIRLLAICTDLCFEALTYKTTYDYRKSLIAPLLCNFVISSFNIDKMYQPIGNSHYAIDVIGYSLADIHTVFATLGICSRSFNLKGREKEKFNLK